MDDMQPIEIEPASRGTEQQKKVLVFASDFSTSDDDRWLIDDLVDEFLSAGASVDVLVFDSKRPRPRGVTTRNDGQLRIISVGPESPSAASWHRLLGRLSAGIRMHTSAYRVLSSQTYDLAVFMSVGAVSMGLPRRLRAKRVVKNLVFVLWDFFPVHQIEIGRLPSRGIFRFLRHLELFSFANADTVALMSPANQRYFEAYFPEYQGDSMIVPPWAQTDRQPVEPIRNSGVLTAIFGGQLVQGRGIEAILQAAAILKERQAEVKFLIAGDGSLRAGLESTAQSLGLGNLEFLGSLPRPEYRELLRTAHIGIAATVDGVSVPAFPSKIVEYCRASLPVVACLDTATDAGDILSEFGAGVVVPANNAEMLADALQSLALDRHLGKLDEMSHSARRLFETRLSATHAAAAILASADERHA